MVVPNQAAGIRPLIPLSLSSGSLIDSLQLKKLAKTWAIVNREFRVCPGPRCDHETWPLLSSLMRRCNPFIMWLGQADHIA